MTDFEHGSAKDLKIGKYVIVDDVPCRVVGIEVSAPGKHGAAKMRITTIGIFDGSKRILLKPSDADIQLPIIERKRGQIVTLTGNMAQVMDLTTFENFEMELPEDMRAGAEAGKEIEYMEAMGRKLIMRID